MEAAAPRRPADSGTAVSQISRSADFGAPPSAGCQAVVTGVMKSCWTRQLHGK